MTSRATLLLLPLLLMGCALLAPAPPADPMRRITVLPPGNRTGDDLLVEGAALLEKYAPDTDRVTVGDVLAAELRARLAKRGFAVVAPDVVRKATEGRGVASPEAAVELARNGHLTAPLLVVSIDRWEAKPGTHADFVIVGLDVWLVDPASGAVVWHAHRRANPIATPGAVTLASAYEMAAAKAAEELVGWLGAPGPW
ncbi:MAG TPA: hypothetical protein VMS22_18395 [Candidatus Eisenbacteria bacterium]|nr:hypothetical protein [Candidatus Eisenbacteria bacterium]